MKIHTIQNLRSTADYKSTNITMPEEPGCENYSRSILQSCGYSADSFESTAFKGKKTLLNKAVETGKKKFGERVANSSWGKKLLGSDSFSKTAQFTGEQEVIVQSIVALAICCGLRPATIMALPGDKNKKDCAYASAQSFSSGIFGFIIPLLFCKPLTAGFNHALEHAGEYVKDENLLKEMWPHLNIDSIKGTEGNRKPMKEWLDTSGNKFIPEIKDVRKVPLPKHVSKVSNETLDSYIENDKVKQDKLKEVFIAFQEGEEGKESVQYIPLLHADEEILKELFPNLDTGKIIKDTKRIDPAQWVNRDGQLFELNKENAFISDWKEAEDVIPFITGKQRVVGKDKKGNDKLKYTTYQKNNLEGDLYSIGTEITSEMDDADKVNSVVRKLGNWIPDTVIAYPRATATIAIIPWVLKNLLHIEKTPKPPKEEQMTEKAPKAEVSGKEAA